MFSLSENFACRILLLNPCMWFSWHCINYFNRFWMKYCAVSCVLHSFLSFPSKGFLHESWISACFCNSIHQIVSRRMNVCVITLRRAMAYNLVIGFVNQPIVELRLILCNSDGFFRDFSTHVDGDQIFLTKVSNFRKCFWIENFIEVVDTAIHASKYSHEKVRLIKRVFVITLSQRVTTN